MRAGFAVNELDVDAYAVLIALNGALRARSAPPAPWRFAWCCRRPFVLEGEGGVARNHRETVADAGQVGGEGSR